MSKCEKCGYDTTIDGAHVCLDGMERVTLLGEKANGSRDVLGTVQKPPAMKRHEIVRDFFGEPGGPDDCDEASLCLCALEQYHDWLLRQGWTAPQLTVTPNSQSTTG